MPRSIFAGTVALVLILATGSAMARLSGPILGIDLVELARAQIGNGAIYGRQKLWCARFVNWLLEHAGYRGTKSDAAKSFLHFPHTFARVGAIAVLWRKGGGHVGIVSGFDHAGNPVLISGNHGHRVYEATYPHSRVLAYVVPANPHAAPDKAPNTIADFEADDGAHRRIIDSVHKRIIELPPVRVRQRVVSNSGEPEITPGTVSNAVSRTAMLQGSNRASRSDPPAGQEWSSQEWRSQEWNSWEQNSWEHNSWEQKTQEKGKQQTSQGQKSKEQNGSERNSWEQNSWEHNSWEQKSWDQQNGSQVRQSEASPPIRPGAP